MEMRCLSVIHYPRLKQTGLSTPPRKFVENASIRFVQDTHLPKNLLKTAAISKFPKLCQIIKTRILNKSENLCIVSFQVTRQLKLLVSRFFGQSGDPSKLLVVVIY